MVNSKKVKKEKKNKNEWSNVDKINECEKIKKSIQDLGLGESFEEIKDFFNLLDNYCNQQISLSGSIKIHSINKNLIYQLPLSLNHQPIVKLVEL